MAGTTNIFLPELLYEFKTYIESNSDLPLQSYIKNLEVTYNEFYIKENNLFKILFDNNFGLDLTSDSSGTHPVITDEQFDIYSIVDYTGNPTDTSSGEIYNSNTLDDYNITYLFKEYPASTFGVSHERRIKSSNDLIQGFISDNSGNYDLFDLYNSESQNSIMLNKLLNYRLGNVVLLDDITYEELNYNLAKLIYIYLNLVINGIITEFDTTDSISSNSLVENLFEIYVLNESHKLIKTWKNFLDTQTLELRPVRKKYTVDDDLLDLGYIYLTNDLPYDTDKIFVYKNGELQSPEYYSFINDSSSFTLNIDSTGDFGLNLQLNDILILDTFTSVNVLNP